jgi:hypothetical protein
MLSLAPFAFEAFQQGRELGEFSAQSEYSRFLLAQSPFQIFQLPQDVAQFAFHRKRALCALFAARDRYVMEALAGL